MGGKIARFIREGTSVRMDGHLSRQSLRGCPVTWTGVGEKERGYMVEWREYTWAGQVGGSAERQRLRSGVLKEMGLCLLTSPPETKEEAPGSWLSLSVSLSL